MHCARAHDLTTMTRKSRRTVLHELAERVGIISEYLDQTGKETRKTTDATRIELLRIMGIDAANDESAMRALDALDAQERERIIEPVRVMRQGRARSVRTELALPEGWSGTIRWELVVEEEGGKRRKASGRGRATRGTLALAVPLPRETGYHTVRLRLSAGKEAREAEQSLIIVPERCLTPDDLLGGRRVFGIIANLYSVRSERNWGVGDLEDLARLLVWSGTVGAEFVGVNPLHALRNRGMDVSPYSPVSRVYRNAIYLDPERIPIVGEADVRDLLASDDVQRELAELRASTRVEYERVMALKHRVLHRLHERFADAGTSNARAREYARYRETQGEPLERFAIYQALDAHFTREGHDGGFREWPEEFRSPESAAVRRFADSHASDVDYHRWIQFELDCQLAAAADRARSAELAIGLYQDLAIGTSPNGSDVWSYPHLFVQGASIGAPPDPYSATGQNWGLPPIHPHHLREDRYGYWISLVRASLRHAGALRIDHVMGLFRQFWIPEGKSGKEGAYVRFPADDLLGILALESSRTGALVVGEDLGTVPKEVPPALESWGILSSKVLYFERGRKGSFVPATQYEPLALATANTHDMATLAGFWSGGDLELREKVGLANAKETRAAKRERQQHREELVDRLAKEGILDDDGTELDETTVRGAVHEFLARTPSALVGFALDDLTGEVEPVNVPGVGPDKYPSWTRRMQMPVEQIPFAPGVAAALRRADRSDA